MARAYVPSGGEKTVSSKGRGKGRGGDAPPPAPPPQPREFGVLPYRLPFEYYAKYLIVMDRPRAKRRLLEDGFRLPQPDFDTLVEQLEEDGPIPDMRRPLSETAGDFLKRHQIAHLDPQFEPENNCLNSVFQVLRKRPKRQLLELLIACNIGALGEMSPDEHLLQRFYEGTTIRLTIRALRVYRHFFWNCNLMQSTDWMHFLIDMGLLALTGEYIDHYPNGNRILRSTRLTANLTLYETGFSGVTLATSSMLGELKTAAYALAMAAKEVGNMRDFALASSIVIQADKASKDSGTGTAAVIEMLKQVHLLGQSVGHRSLHELTAGHHSERATILAMPSPETRGT